VLDIADRERKEKVKDDDDSEKTCHYEKLPRRHAAHAADAVGAGGKGDEEGVRRANSSSSAGHSGGRMNI
jgi:hypothetical protein